MLGRFQFRGVLLVWLLVRQGPIALAVDAVQKFFLSSIVSSFSL